jgi:large subunit ribosomal protein L22
MSAEDEEQLDTPADRDAAETEPVVEPGAETVEAAVPAAAAAAEPDVPEAEAEEDAEADADGEDGEDDGEPEADGDETDEDDSGAEAEPGAEAAPKRRIRRRRTAAADEPERKAAKPARTPRRSRSKRDPSLPPPTVRAQARYVRSSARKARLVCDHIRGKSVEDARAILAVTPRAVARDWSKLLESAVANAEHNHELVGEELYIKAVHADEGPTIKRFRPRAQGRATRIRKRTSHLTILLTPKD